jgi:error-prone DNA polymerase
LAFLRETLNARGYLPCSALRTAANGRRISIAGLVLVRQMPDSAKGVMFVTLEDESANANLIVWPAVFETNRRAILNAAMLGCRGKVQSANGVIHLIIEQVVDLSADLKRISGLDARIRLQSGRGDDAKRGGSGADSREPKAAMINPREMYEPDLQIDMLRLKARNFR